MLLTLFGRLHISPGSRLALLMLTDAPFVYQPAQISFTALHQAAVALNVQQTLEDYALKKFNDDILVGELYKCVQEMEALQAAWNAAMPKIDRLKQIDAKLALCRNAASDVDSVQCVRLSICLLLANNAMLPEISR